MENQRPFPEIEPADDVERVAVHAGRHRIRARSGLHGNGVGKVFLRLRVERVDRDGAGTESFDEDGSLVHAKNEAWPQVDEKEPGRDTDPTEDQQMLVLHMHQSALTTGGTVYSPR